MKQLLPSSFIRAIEYTTEAILRKFKVLPPKVYALTSDDIVESRFRLIQRRFR